MNGNEQELNLLVEYFKSLREEIHLRIRQHTQLVWIKIVSLGAIISFLIERFYVGGIDSELSSSLWLYLVWIIPLAAIIFDFLLAGNLRDINNLGVYIRDHFEKKSFRKYVSDPGFKFWEECVGQADPKYRCYTWQDMVVIWLFTLGSSVFSGLLRWQIGFNYFVDIPLIVLCVVGLFSALWYLIRSITMEREFLYPEIENVPNIKWRKAK